jgi:hypothetical protein
MLNVIVLIYFTIQYNQWRIIFVFDRMPSFIIYKKYGIKKYIYKLKDFGQLN